MADFVRITFQNGQWVGDWGASSMGASGGAFTSIEEATSWAVAKAIELGLETYQVKRRIDGEIEEVRVGGRSQ